MKKILLIAALAGFTTSSFAQYHYKDCPNGKISEKTTCTKKHKHRQATACFKDPKKNAAQSDCDAPVYGKDIVYTGYYPKKERARKAKAMAMANAKKPKSKAVATASNGNVVPVGVAGSK